MTRNTPPPLPTDDELAILRVLWERGPSTVRQVHDVLSKDRPAGYTTALKLVQIMTEKGLVRRDETRPKLTQQFGAADNTLLGSGRPA